MAQGRKRGVALAAALAAITCERARDRPRVPVAFTGPSGPDRRLARMARPAAERATDPRLPVPSRLSAVFAEVPRAVRASSVITAAVAPHSCLAGAVGRVRPQRAAVTMTAFPAGSRLTAEPMAREIPAGCAPRAGGRGRSCAVSGPEFSDRPLTPQGGNAPCAPPGSENVRLLTDTSRRDASCASSGVNSANRPLAGTPGSVRYARPVAVRTPIAARRHTGSTSSSDHHSPDWYAYNAWYSLRRESARRHPSEAEHAGALPADTTRKGEFAMRDTWT
jgi:hypothetical protein